MSDGRTDNLKPRRRVVHETEDQRRVFIRDVSSSETCLHIEDRTSCSSTSRLILFNPPGVNTVVMFLNHYFLYNLVASALASLNFIIINKANSIGESLRQRETGGGDPPLPFMRKVDMLESHWGK